MATVQSILVGRVLRSPARDGVVEFLPFVPGTLAWGILFGAAAIPAGLSQSGATLMSLIVYSGTAQLAIIKLLATPALTVFSTSLLLSIRFLPMAVAVNARLPTSRWRRVLVSATIVDASFAISARRGRQEGGLAPYLLGAGACSYATWITGTLIGAGFGALIPSSWTHTVEGFTVVIFVILAADLCASWRLAATALSGAAIGLAASRFLPAGVAMLIAATAAAAIWAPRARTSR